MKEYILFAVAILVAGLIGGFASELVGNQSAPAIGGSTADNWNIGGNLTVDGTSTLASTVDVTGTATVGRFEQGGGIVTLTDANGGAFTLTQTQMQSGIWSFAAGGQGQETITITMPATSTLTAVIPNAGDFATWIYDSTNLVAATTTTFVAGTGMTLHEPDGGNLVIEGATMATITCWRRADTDIECVVIEGQPG